MIDIKEVKNLAELSRIKMTEEEMVAFANEIDPILDYVAQIKKVTGGSDEREVPALHNVMRGDDQPNPTGTNTEVLTAEFPRRGGNFLKVKKIL
jgi:aspartyl/glutamyl-tRNA(Asn/Gln) amidotransferase C subunit